MRMLRTGLAIALVFSLTTGDTSTASAQDHADFNTEVRVANKHYAAKEYAKAAAKYVYAYTIRPEPMLLFNTASCYRHLKRTAEALRYYKRFLKTRPPDPLPRSLDKARQIAKSWIVELEPKKSAAKAGTDTKTGTGSKTGTDTDTKLDPSTASPPPEPPATASGNKQPPATENRGAELTTSRSAKPDGKRKFAWISLGVGGVGLIGAGIFAMMANSAVDTKNKEPTQENADKVETLELRTNISWAIAVVGLAAGATLYFLSRPKKTNERSTSLTVAPLDNGAAAVVFGRF